jgi:formate hydrogenlyase transcriptional activator
MEVLATAMNPVMEFQSEYPASERYEPLIRVSQAISGYQDTEELFCAIAAELHQVVRFDKIAISQFNGDSERVCRLMGIYREESADFLIETSTQWVYHHQEPRAIPYLKDEIRFDMALTARLQAEGLHSLCVLPLTTIHRRIGSLGLASKIRDAYSGGEVQSLSLVAAQIATPIDDALNFKAFKAAEAKLKDRNDRLQLLLEINNTLVSNLEFRELLRAISSNLRSLMQCDAAVVGLKECETNRVHLYAVDLTYVQRVVQEGQLVA